MSICLSDRWHHVAALRPRLSGAAVVRRQRVRGQCWFVYGGLPGRKPLRLNASAHRLAARLDGQRSVEQVWEAAQSTDGEPPTQDEVIALLTRLRDAGLADLGGTVAAPATPAEAAPPRSPWALRLTLGRPAAWLEPLRPLARLLFHPLTVAAWAVAVALLVLGLAQHASALAAHAGEWLATPRYALLGALLYVPLKGLHELAHALAVLRGGGTVHRWGVTLMFGLPMPWVDASDAAAFPRAGDRARVGAAGMAAELAVAAAALPLWLSLPDGLLRDACFVTLLLAGLSTVLFNANPLQRLDGYHLLTDLAGLPNLATRSSAWWRQTLAAWLQGRPPEAPMPLARGERAWLIVYAPAAAAWMVGVVVIAAGWAAAWSPWLGAATLVAMGGATLVLPAARLLSALRAESRADAATARRWRVAVAGAGLCAVGLFATPLPHSLTLTGVVWPDDDAQLRAGEAGRVASIERADGDRVRPGDVVVQLANAELDAAWERQQARIAAAEVAVTQAGVEDRFGGDARLGDLQAELDRARAELERLAERRAALAVRAGTAGRVALPQPADMLHGWVAQGQLLGQVDTGQAATVRIALPQDEAVDLPAEPRVEVRLASTLDVVRPAVLLRESRAAVAQLPSAALSVVHGGPVATEPSDPRHLRPLHPVVLLDVRLQTQEPARLGERAWVQLQLPPRTVAERVWAAGTRLLGGPAR